MTKEKFFENTNALDQEEPKKKDEALEIEYRERLERFQTMGKIIGDDLDMAVEVGKERGWRYYFKPLNKIEADPVDIKEKGLDYCFGLIAHEGSHRKISRVDFIPKKIWHQAGFKFLMNAVEDPRVNNWVSEKYDGASDWLEGVYNQDLTAENRLAQVSEEKIGYVPDHVKFGLEIIRYWHTDKFSDDLPQNIKETLEKTISYAELAYNSIPAENPDENDITEKAQATYKIVYSAIWPRYQQLVDKSFEDEELRQMINDLAENGSLEIPPEIQQEKPTQKDSKKGEEKKNGKGEEKKDGKKKEIKFKDLPESSKSDLKKKIKEILDKMPEKQRKEIEERARQKAKNNLGELEGKLNKELKGHLVEQPKTKFEEEEEKEKEKQEKRTKEELAKAKKEIENKLEREKTQYDKTFQEVKPYIDKVSNDIINLFAAKRFPKFKRSFPGQTLRLEGAKEWEAKGQYKNLFERRLSSERKDISFLLLIDLSGSMDGQKIEEAFKAAVLFAEALNKAGSILGGIKVEIYGFQDDLIEYKKQGEKLDNKLREKMSTMKLEVKDDGHHNQASYNNDGFCLDKASKILSQTQSKEQFLIILSDGKPAGDDNHRVLKYKELSQEEELKAVVKGLSSANKQKILAIGLGPGTDHVKMYYNNELPNVENIVENNIHQLPKTLGKKLEKLIIK